MATTATNSTVILDTPTNWKPWIFIIRNLAQGHNVWEYLDPDDKTPLEVPDRLLRPQPSDIAQGKTLATFTASERELYKLMYQDYKDEDTEVLRIHTGIQAVRTKILNTIQDTNMTYIYSSDTVHEMLVALKKRFAPTDHAQRIETIAKYNTLRTYNKRMKIEEYLKQWEITYAEAKLLHLAEVQDSRPLYDFTLAVSSLDPSWSTSQEFVLTTEERKGLDGSLPEVIDLIEDFRNHRRRVEALNKRPDLSAFATGSSLMGQDQDGKSTCLCGEQHRYSECNYITPSTRSDGWKGKIAIYKKINKAITSNRRYPNSKKWFQTKFKYDGFKVVENKSNDNDSEGSQPEPSTKSSRDDSTSEGDSKKGSNFVTHHKKAPRGSFTTYHAFTGTSTHKDYKLYNSWTLDSGTDVHVCNDKLRSCFTKTREADEDEQLFAGKRAYAIECFGSVNVGVNTPDGTDYITLVNVALAPGFITNLVSLDLLNVKDVHWNSADPTVLRKHGEIFCNLERVGGHWVLERHTTLAAFATSKSKARSTQPRHNVLSRAYLHRVLAHAGPEAIDHVVANADDITIDDSIPCPTTIQCEPCSLSKATEIVSRRTDREFVTNGKPYDIFAWDMFFMSTAYNGDSIVSHFRCMNTHHNIVATHATKSEAFSIFEDHIARMERQWNCKPRAVLLDGETSLGTTYENFIKDKGMISMRTAPDTHEPNGPSESSGRVIQTKGRAMNIEAGIPTELWPEPIKAAVYIMNRTPVKALSWKTPHEALTGKPPIYAHMHVYGCKAYALDKHIPRTFKLDPRAHIGYLVGYESTNVYRIWVPSKDKVIRTRDVKFDDNSLYRPDDLDIGAVIKEDAERLLEALELPENQPEAVGDNNDALDYIVVEVPGYRQEDDHAGSTNQKSMVTDGGLLTPEASPPPSFQDSTILPISTQSTVGEAEITEEHLPGAQGNTAHRGNEISGEINPENVLTHSRRSAHITSLEQVKNIQGYHAAFSAALNAIPKKRLHRGTLPPEPKSWKHMLKHLFAKEFKAAADKEIDILLAKNMFTYKELSTIKSTETPLLLMWVFTYKFDKDGYLERFKARLVARGDLQATKEDTYAATLAAQTFRAMMALTAAYDLEIRQFDVINAFANAKLPKPMVCACPEGYERQGYVLWVTKALYGLRPSPIYWYKEFTGTLMDLGLRPVPGTPCIYINGWLTIIFFVDDILCLYSTKDTPKMDEFEAKLKAKYQLHTIPDADHFLGIRILRDRPNRKLWLLQDSYIDKLADKFNITIDKVPKTPLPSQTPMARYDGTATASQINGYQQKVGSAIFSATFTRPDITKATSDLSRYLQNPGPEQLHAVQHCLHYIVGTKYLAIEFDGNKRGADLFTCASDASFADDITTRYSSYGNALTLFGGPVFYKACIGRTVTTSSTEAELLALCITAKIFIEWLRFFAQIAFYIDKEPTIKCDNLQTIRLLKKETPKLQTALRHVDIHQCWLRQEVQAGHINVEWVDSNHNLADGFTKLLPPQKHIEFIRQLNLVDIKERLFPIKDSSAATTTPQA